MRGLGLAVVLLAALSSCDPDAARAVEACSVICDCQAPTFDQDTCLNQCVSEATDQIAQLPAACLACISEHRDRCLSLETDCEPLCDQGIDNPPPEPPVIVDGGV